MLKWSILAVRFILLAFDIESQLCLIECTVIQINPIRFILYDQFWSLFSCNQHQNFYLVEGTYRKTGQPIQDKVFLIPWRDQSF